MGSIRIDVDSVRAIGQAIEAASKDGFSEVNSLAARFDPSAVWTSNASQSYQAAIDRWKQAQLNVHQALEELGREVKNIAENFRIVDETNFG
ncbi:WXG100 family type VII secretion target [Pseudarthrobacter sp. NPDC058196]|uniref:WXG100 family type VII secretion target n=1 Tax=Pseudarthrobacter sp. NPDC058196 TaxID=3346376 RepID=UPI0036D7DEED